MHESEFCNSFHPALFKVFGVVLDAYAIGHELALIRDGNPLVSYTAASFSELEIGAKRLALLMAVEVCGKVGAFRKWIIAMRASRADDEGLKAEIEAFQSYRAAGSLDLPLAKMPRQGGGVPFHYFGAPELARLLNFVTEKHGLLIQSHFGGSPLNFPLGLAQILHSTHLESEGSIWVKNYQDMQREAPPKPGTPAPGANEKVFVGDEAEKVFSEAAKLAEKGNK